MSQWRRRWQITFTWRPDIAGGRVHATRVDTPAQLRAVIDWARAHPDVTGHRHESVHELVGDPPVACGRGHSFHGGSATRVTLAWLSCPCGGHVVYLCRTPGCRDVRVDPEIGPHCRPHRPVPT